MYLCVCEMINGLPSALEIDYIKVLAQCPAKRSAIDFLVRHVNVQSVFAVDVGHTDVRQLLRHFHLRRKVRGCAA